MHDRPIRVPSDDSVLSTAAGDVLRYGKTLAAFSNTDGGVIVFGVTDAPRFLGVMI